MDIDTNPQWLQIVKENGLEPGTVWYMEALNYFLTATEKKDESENEIALNELWR